MEMQTRTSVRRGRQVRFDELPGALATLIRECIEGREAAGGMPDLVSALGKADSVGASPADELLVLHLAAVDIALQVDGRFNGLVHEFILQRTAHTLETKGGLREALRARLPVYLEWMFDFVSAQLDTDVPEPRDVLGLDDAADSAVVLLALGELVSLCHGALFRWDLVASSSADGNGRH